MSLLRRYPLTVVLVAAIWVLSLVPGFPETPLDDVALADKWAHFLMYGGTFGVMWVEHLRRPRATTFARRFVLGWLCPVLMGGLLEVLQATCTATRSGDWLDFVANGVGVTLAAAFGAIYGVARRSR